MARRGNPAWFKGCKPPNPHGRKGRTGAALGRAIRANVDPEELVEIALAIARGQGIHVRDSDSGAAVSVHMPTVRDQLEALKFLADRGWIKPPKQKQLTIDDNRTQQIVAFDPSKLSDEQLGNLDKLLGTMVVDPPKRDDEEIDLEGLKIPGVND